MTARLKLICQRVVPCSFETLVSLFARGDITEYAKKLPFLTSEQIQQLHNKMGEYFLHATDLQLYQKAHKQVKQAEKLIAANKSQRKIDQILHLCGEALASERTYEPELWPAFMVFEFFSGFTLRQEQSADLKQLMKLDQASGSYRSMILQRIMS